jgi:hypothetical protein
MTDTLERFLEDLRFDVPAGLVDRAKAAAVITESEAVEDGGHLASRSRDLVGKHRSIRSGLADRSRPIERRTELAAGIAAVVIAAIVIGSFAYIRAVTCPHTVAPPPRPSPTLTRALKVDPATPVILFNDAGDNYQVDGVTWDGQSGKLTQVPNRQNANSATASNPAGTLFVTFPNVLDRSGHVVAKLDSSLWSDPRYGFFLGVWADDEQHYCQMVPAVAAGTNPAPATLQVTTPGGRPRDVVQLGTQSVAGMTVTVTVCSVLGDRAVVVQREQDFIQYWVVQLSNGRVLWTHTLKSTCPGAPGVTVCGLPNIVASRDGRYVSEEILTHTALITGPDGSKTESVPAGPSTIYGPDGSPVGNVDGSIRAFSWDGSLAVIFSKEGRPSVVRWIGGTVIWTAPHGKTIWAFQSEPAGTSIAILTADPWGYGNPTLPGLLYLVSSDGHVVAQLEVGGGVSGGLLVCRDRCL